MKKVFKTFILAALLAVTGNKANACGYCEPTYEHDIFLLTLHAGLHSQSVAELLAKEWSKYINATVSVEESEALADLTPSDVDKMNHPVLDYARNHNDREMLTYLRYLARYLAAANVITANEWSYPTAEEIEASQQEFKKLLNEVGNVKSPRLADRYFLLKMRLLFRLERYDECVSLWKKNSGKDNVFNTIAKGFYGGALYHTNKIAEAAVVYSEIGDEENAKYCMSSYHGAKSMNAVIQNDPNSPILSFMLEKAMNSVRESNEFLNCRKAARELRSKGWITLEDWNKLYKGRVNPAMEFTEDYDKMKVSGDVDVKDWFFMLPTYAVYEEECKELEQIIVSQVNNKAVKDKSMWRGAMAYMQFLKGDSKDAWKNVEKAMKDEGEQQSKDNARVIRAYMASHLEKEADMQKYLIQDFEWMKSKNQEGLIGSIAAYGLVPRYQKEGNKLMQILSCELADGGNFYWGEQAEIYNTMTLQEQIDMYNTVASAPKSDWVKYLLSNSIYTPDALADQIGTRLLREGKWELAQEYLSKVSLEYLQNQSIVPYVVARSWKIEPWKQLQPVDAEYDIENWGKQLKTNKKLAFCKEVQQLELQFQNASGNQRGELAYLLAVRYFQASAYGDCWWLARYYVHANRMDRLNVDPEGSFDFLGKAYEMACVAKQNSALKPKALFTNLYNPKYEIYTWEPTENWGSYNLKLNTDSPLMTDLGELVSYLRNEKVELYVEEFLNSCDVLSQLIKAYN